MSLPFLAQIQIMPYTFAVRSWTFCSGQYMPISQNPSLFSIIGNIYGGDARVTFQVPQLQARAPMGHGIAPGLLPRIIGQHWGESMVTLVATEIPSHSHGKAVFAQELGETHAPGSNTIIGVRQEAGAVKTAYGPASTNKGLMDSQAVSTEGVNSPHENHQPLLGMAFQMALDGIYPSRS